jgi:hypothetical protein
MPATKIMVIRHAEKPDGEPGIMPDGSQNPEALTAAGWRRARALAGMFAPADGSFVDSRLSRPGALFASGSDSLRPKQTLTPLAVALNLVVDATYLKGQEDLLVGGAKSADGVALIAWQHEAIPKIAMLIQGSADSVPPRWPGHRFDLVWVFDRQNSGAWSFDQVPELALPGDSSQPIAPDD